MDRNKEKRRKWLRRHKRVRGKVSGTPERPRLTVYRSLKNIYAQVIDDGAGRTLAAASTRSAELEGQTSNVAGAEAVGKLLAEKAQAAGVKRVCFDRGGYQYHGRVKALADAARKAGLEF